MVEGKIERLRLSFALLGTFDPDFVTDRLQFAPTRTAVRREGRQGIHKVAEDIWELSRTYQDHSRTNKCIDDFLDDLVVVSKKLNRLRGIV
ncbi:DUF4279 domain-containing protein [Deinococcus apachensis]|uniref:DUF4279 domain-containing protein n=1 Tax=Deinococcus apachensis TaxID=309886 RepID=UPI0012FCA987